MAEINGSAGARKKGNTEPGSTVRPARGSAHFWIPRGRGDVGVVLGLILDGPEGYPNNMSALGRQFDIHRDTARDLRDEVLRRQWAVIEGGFLVATESGRAVLRAGSDPLPRALLRQGGERASMAVLRACAVIYGDAIGWRADRPGVRNDTERAALAAVSRRLVVAARALLQRLGLIEVERLRRGRADLRRARLTADRRATHGAPMAVGRAGRLAALAERGRARPSRGADPRNSEGADPRNTPLQLRRPRQAPPAPSDGSQRAREGCGGTPPPTATVRRSARPRSASNVLDEILPAMPTVVAVGNAHAKHMNAAALAALGRFAADPRIVSQHERQPTTLAMLQLLEAAHVHDRAPRRRAGLALQVGRVLRPAQLVMLWADVALARPRSIAGTLTARLRRAVAGDPELLTRTRSDWTVMRFLNELARRHPDLVARDPGPRTATQSAPVAASATTPAKHTPTTFAELLQASGLGPFAARRPA